MYTPKLRSGIAFFHQEREQGRFRGSTERALKERGEAKENTEVLWNRKLLLIARNKQSAVLKSLD